jgi:hypothetical protein
MQFLKNPINQSSSNRFGCSVAFNESGTLTVGHIVSLCLHAYALIFTIYCDVVPDNNLY